MCDALCEVSLANYAPRLYVSAGDSLYLQIDFKDLLHPVVKGSRAALNQGMQHFVGEGYYLPDYYYAEDIRASGEAFDKAVEKGYEERKQRRADFLTRYSPGDDVAKLTERMLLADYCAERFRYAREHLRQILIEKRTDWKQEMAGYEALLPEVNALFSDEVITSAHFRLLYHLNFYLQYRRYAVGDESFTDMDLVDEQQGNMLSQFLLANMLGNSLVHNDTVDFTTAVRNTTRWCRCLCCAMRWICCTGGPWNICSILRSTLIICSMATPPTARQSSIWHPCAR